MIVILLSVGSPLLSENMVATKMAPEVFSLRILRSKKTNVANVLP